MYYDSIVICALFLFIVLFDNPKILGTHLSFLIIKLANTNIVQQVVVIVWGVDFSINRRIPILICLKIYLPFCHFVTCKHRCITH